MYMNTNKSITLHKAIITYLEWKQTHTNSAYSAYKPRLDGFQEFVGMDTPIESINGDHVVAFHKSLEGKYSLATIAYSARILRNFFWFWKGRGFTNLNPKEIIPIRFAYADKDIVTQDDFYQLNMVLDERYAEDLVKKLVLHLLWDTGSRVSELLDIEIGNISKQGSDGLRNAKIRTRKNMRYNLLVWGADTNELLNQYLGMRLCMDTQNNHLLINPKTGKPFTPRSIQRWIKELTAMTLIDKNITPHSFRHGKANMILEEGGDMRDVSAILRHTSLHSSITYVQLCAKRYQKTAGKFLRVIPTQKAIA